ncbi:MAG TPA: CBASS cGAMP-activated phospholipase [Methylomirabilota bacterium]|nr:CBASS cGAMP-activated phospholipase [Methylomirabilota bacterium]
MRDAPMETAPNCPIKVLAIDGGGIRGIIPAIILGAFEKALAKPLHKVFDLIAGTSTGGIIALGLGTKCKGDGPYTSGDLLELYVQNGPAIFRRQLLTAIRQVFRPKYSPAALESILTKYFGDTVFSSALTNLLISSYNLQSQLPFFFKSERAKSDPDYDWKVRDIARATSAAPTFFPPFHLQSGAQDYALVDGGVFANNPAMAAYAEARHVYPEAQQYVVVRVGTGDRQDHISFAAARNWGLLPWAKQIVPVFMDSVSEAVDYELNQLPSCAYHMFQPSLEGASNEMDDVSAENLSNLQSLANRYVQSAAKQIADACEDLAA